MDNIEKLPHESELRYINPDLWEKVNEIIDRLNKLSAPAKRQRRRKK